MKTTVQRDNLANVLSPASVVPWPGEFAMTVLAALDAAETEADCLWTLAIEAMSVTGATGVGVWRHTNAGPLAVFQVGEGELSLTESPDGVIRVSDGILGASKTSGAVPIASQRDVWGWFALCWPAEHRVNPDGLATLPWLGRLTGILLERIADNNRADAPAHRLASDHKRETETRALEASSVALRRGEAHYRTLIEQLPAGVYRRAIRPGSTETELIYASPRLAELTGQSVESLLAANHLSHVFVHPDDLEQLTEDARRLAQGDDNICSEYRYVFPSGEIRWVRTIVRQLPDVLKSNAYAHVWQGLLFDITDEKRQAAERDEVKQRLSALVDTIPATTFVEEYDDLTEQWRHVFISPQVTGMTGFDAETFATHQGLWRSRIAPDDLAAFTAAQSAPENANKRYQMEYRFQHQSGEWVWLREAATIIDLGGRWLSQGVIVDVSQERRSERELRASEERYRALVEQLPSIVTYLIEINPDTLTRDLVYISPRIEVFSGVPATDWYANPAIWKSLLHPDDRDRVQHGQSEIIANGKSIDTEFRLVRPDGDVRWVRNVVRCLGDSTSNQEARVWQGLLIDITEQRKAMESVRRQDARFRALVQESAEIITILDARGHARYHSPAIEAVLGYQPEAMLDAEIFSLVHPDDVAGLLAAFERLLEGGPDGREIITVRLRRADDQWRWLEINGENKLADEDLLGLVIHSRDVTERRLAEEAFLAEHEQLESVMRHVQTMIYVKDTAGRFTRVNDLMVRTLGLRGPEDMIGKTDAELFSPEETADYGIDERQVLTTGQPVVNKLESYRGPDDALRWILTTKVPLRNALGDIIGLVGNSRDITDRVEVEAALAASEERFRSLVQHASDITAILDQQGTVTYISPSVERVLGYPPERVIGLTNRGWVQANDRPRVQAYLDSRRSGGGATEAIEVACQHADGGWRYLEAVGTALFDDPNIRGIVVNARDVTERRNLEERLLHQAFHDPLTGLPNRVLFQDRLNQAQVRANALGQRIAVLFLDLDDFKVVNDTLGHYSGDQLLKEIAKRLRQGVRPGDTVARQGGDEFTVLLEAIADPKDATIVAQHLLERLQEPAIIAGHDITIVPSIGVAVSSLDDAEGRDLTRDADVAMYEAKNRGKSQWVLFNSGMNAPAWSRLSLQGELRRAMTHDQLRVYFQPQVSLTTGRIVEFEALVRWEHPTRGLVSPDEFIPFAEETGLIVPLGRAVLAQACREAQRWLECPNLKNDPDLSLSVNLSVRQFSQPSLCDDIAEILTETGMRPDRLRLEITESAALHNADAALETMRDLRRLGVRLAIDDFGAGYSGLGYLRRCPINTIKIDRSYVAGLEHDASDTAMIRAVMVFAQTLGLDVTAEGVETVEQLRQLTALGCDRAQGFYFSEPLPARQVHELLSRDPCWTVTARDDNVPAFGATS